jgi:galactokinase
VDAFMSAGALGARLTGAGWGGCVVAVCESDIAEEILADVKKSFYEKRFQSGVANIADETNLLFKTAPSAGAAILHYDDEKGVIV